MIIANWNEKGWSNEVKEVIKKLEQIKVSIAVNPEPQKKGRELNQIGNKLHIFIAVPKNQGPQPRIVKSVSIFFEKKLGNWITNW